MSGKLTSDQIAGLREFVKESNRIEGIVRGPNAGEMREHAEFLALDTIRVDNLIRFVRSIQPGAVLREWPGMNVRVGDHRPPPGGPHIREALAAILDDVRTYADPYEIHHRYETLHPFMDGNGRSGRVLWLWQMFVQLNSQTPLRLGFLHIWYYQTLSRGYRPAGRAALAQAQEEKP